MKETLLSTFRASLGHSRLPSHALGSFRSSIGRLSMATKSQVQSEGRSVLVLGAGIIGLQSAVTLLERGYKTAVVAKHLPGDSSVEYTSPWAGAHWRPHGTPDDAKQARWDMDSYEEWMRILSEENKLDVPAESRSGIAIVPSLLLWDSNQQSELQPSGDPSSLWFASHVRDFSICKPLPSMPQVAVAGRFTALTIDVPNFLAYLMRRIRALGGFVVRAAVPMDQGLDVALSEARQAAQIDTNPVFVNATGISARSLVPDKTVYPARGQVVLVRGAAPECRTFQGIDSETGASYISYCIPRPDAGVSILGGSKGLGDWNGEEDVDLTRTILQRACKLCPELLGEDGTFEVLGVQVGLRPMREKGARVERELLKDETSVVVHAYGHGGAGFQNSIGVARTVAALVEG